MKKTFLLLILIISTSAIFAQKIDSICFHLYTDSLKKGTHNYINVDGKLSSGKWQPLNDKQIKLSGTNCIFEGNDLILPAVFTEENVTVKAVLKNNPAIWKEVTVWIKKKPDDERLPTIDELLNDNTTKKDKEKKRNKKKSR